MEKRTDGERCNVESNASITDSLEITLFQGREQPQGNPDFQDRSEDIICFPCSKSYKVAQPAWETMYLCG